MSGQDTGASVSIVIPALNEAECIGGVIKQAVAAVTPLEVIVVDDGSLDETARLAAEAGAKVLRNPYTIGNGASVKRGALSARGDVVVFLDGDGQHPPDEIPRLLERLDQYDMAVGARTASSGASAFRNFGNWMLIRVARWISRQKIDDLTSGFRAVKRRHLLDYAHLFPTGYSYPTTLTLAMMLGGQFVCYVPMDTIKKRAQGSSNITPFRDFLRFLMIMVRIVVLFSPQRFFFPLGAGIFVASIAVGGIQLWLTGGIQSAGLALFLSGIYIACFGILADQISLVRRQSQALNAPRSPQGPPPEESD